MKYLLKDICNISAGGDVPKGHYSLTKSSIYSVPIYSNGIENEGLYGYTDKAAITDEAITISARGTIGITFRRTKPYYPIVRLISLIPKKSDINLDYLYYALKLYRFKKDGSVQQQLTVPMVGVCEVDLPDLPTQKRIASVLSNIDRKIALNRAMNEELEQTARDLYDYWFLQFDFPDANGNPYRTSGGKMIYNPQLKREIPEGWEVKCVADVLDTKTGKEDANFGTPNGKYKFFTCAVEPLLCDTPAFTGEAILIAGNGNFNVKHYNGKFNAYQRTYVLFPPEKYYGALYFAALERILPFTKASSGSIVKFITKGDIDNITFFEQPDDSIYRQLNLHLALIEKNQEEIDHLTSLRDELLPLLMNGQVTIE